MNFCFYKIKMIPSKSPSNNQSILASKINCSLTPFGLTCPNILYTSGFAAGPVNLNNLWTSLSQKDLGYASLSIKQTNFVLQFFTAKFLLKPIVSFPETKIFILRRLIMEVNDLLFQLDLGKLFYQWIYCPMNFIAL